MALAFPHLFAPIRIGKRQARNRIMRLPTSTNTGEGGNISDRTVALYRDIARGGTGIVVTEGMRVHASNAAGHAHGFLLYHTDIVPSLARLAHAMHAEGALLVAQANHLGASIRAGACRRNCGRLRLSRVPIAAASLTR